MALGDDLKEYGKQKINAVVSALKVKLIIAGIIAIVVFVVVLFCIALLTALAGDDDDNSGTSSSDMADASGDQWEFFIEHYLKSWEGNEGYNSDKTKYKIGLVKGNRTVGYGIDLETSGAEAKLKALGYTSLNVGDYVKVEDVDAIMYEEAKKWYNSVKNSMTSNGVTAKEYQLYAFTDFCYNCGHVGDFYGGQSVGTAYKNYYKSDIDNWYGNYKKYSKTEAIAAKLLEYDKSIPYNQRRRAADGCLFQTGYYGYDIKRTDISTDNRGADAYYSMMGSGKFNNSDGTVNESTLESWGRQMEKYFGLPKATKMISTSWQNYSVSGCTPTSEAKSLETAGCNKYQCTWWANVRANYYLTQNGKKKLPQRAYGNGDTVATTLKEYYNSGKTPKANSVFSMTGCGSGAGHVAYVEAVDTVNGYYYVSHCGSGKSWHAITKVKIGKVPCGTLTSAGYVYLDSPK